MYLRQKMVDGTMISIIVRGLVESRLRRTCFRGVEVCKAGNFSCWINSRQTFSDELFLRQFLAEISELWEKKDFGTHSVEIPCAQVVGWSSTAPLDRYTSDSLEAFNPSRKSVGLRVKLTRTDLLAPQTDWITIVYELKSEDGRPVAVVHSMYPGNDIGELEGDVTEDEQCVFFDWNHPGSQNKT